MPSRSIPRSWRNATLAGRSPKADTINGKITSALRRCRLTTGGKRAMRRSVAATGPGKGQFQLPFRAPVNRHRPGDHPGAARGGPIRPLPAKSSARCWFACALSTPVSRRLDRSQIIEFVGLPEGAEAESAVGSPPRQAAVKQRPAGPQRPISATACALISRLPSARSRNRRSECHGQPRLRPPIRRCQTDCRTGPVTNVR